MKEYLLRKNGMYYAHNNSGYVSRALMAEIYTEEYAKNYEKRSDGEVQAIHLKDALSGPEEVRPYLDRIKLIMEVMEGNV